MTIVFFLVIKYTKGKYRLPSMSFRHVTRMIPTTEEDRPLKETKESTFIEEKKTHAEPIGQPNFNVYPNAPLA